MNAQGLSMATLVAENQTFAGTGGVSSANRHLGFRPGFLDLDSGRVFLSRGADGRPAAFHRLDGLPEELIERDASGRVCATKVSLISGFVREDHFYSREEAARLLDEIEMWAA